MVDGSRAAILTLRKRLTQASSPQCDVVDFFWLRLGKLTAAGLAQAGPKPSVEDDPARHHERESLGDSQRIFQCSSIQCKGPFCSFDALCTLYSQVPLGQFVSFCFMPNASSIFAWFGLLSAPFPSSGARQAVLLCRCLHVCIPYQRITWNILPSVITKNIQNLLAFCWHHPALDEAHATEWIRWSRSIILHLAVHVVLQFFLLLFVLIAVACWLNKSLHHSLIRAGEVRSWQFDPTATSRPNE